MWYNGYMDKKTIYTQDENKNPLVLIADKIVAFSKSRASKDLSKNTFVYMLNGDVFESTESIKTLEAKYNVEGGE